MCQFVAKDIQDDFVLSTGHQFFMDSDLVGIRVKITEGAGTFKNYYMEGDSMTAVFNTTAINQHSHFFS